MQDDGHTAFPVTNGVKQGFVLAPMLFSMVFSAMLTDVFCDGSTDFGTLVTSDTTPMAAYLISEDFRQRQSGTETQPLFADGCVPNTNTHSDMQDILDLFARVQDDVGLTISTQKTEVLHQQAPATAYIEPTINANGERLAVANKFLFFKVIV